MPKRFRSAVIDEYGEKLRLAKLWTPSVNPHLVRLAELGAVIDGWYADFPAEQNDTQEGALYRLEVRPRQFERELSTDARATVFRSLKRHGVNPFTVFLVTQAEIMKHLGEAFLDSVAPKTRTGRRTFSVLAKAAPAVALKKAA